MKSLERVIKQKCKFLGNTTDPEEYRRLQVVSNAELEHLLYMSNTTIETANVITLLEEMKPLFVYITSCVLYERLQLTWKGFYIRIRFLNTYLGDNNDIEFWTNIYENPLGSIQDRIDLYKTVCPYHMSYKKPLRVEILFKSKIINNNIEHNIDSDDNYDNSDHNDDSDHKDDSDNKIEPINDIKTFKNYLCTICLERIPNVLFCLCGHICICEKCNEIKKLNSCPICKTENNILRII